MAYVFVPAHAQYGPRKGPVRAFVIHVAEGGGTVGFLSRPNIRNVSVHFVIEGSGRIVQMVKESHASGSINPNDLRTTDDSDGIYGVTAAKAVMGEWWRDPNSAAITVELEGFARDGPNAKQAFALERLVADVRTRHPSMGLLGHRDFTSRKACPGKLIPWSLLGGHGPKVADVPGLTIAGIEPAAGTVTVKDIAGVQAVQVDNPAQRFTLPPGTPKATFAKGRLVGDPLGKDGPEDRHTVYLIGDELAVLLAGQVTFSPSTPTSSEVIVEVDGTEKARFVVP